jgi:hypothetical protein
MPSPFPGMNPYLEKAGVWRDFHTAFCVHLRAALVPQVRPEFVVGIEEDLYIHELPTERPRLAGVADVGIVAKPGRQTPRGGIALEDPPVEIELAPRVEEIREPFLEIRTRAEQEVVTVIDFLSPTNKAAGADREQYLTKRNRILQSEANLVEIDLLRLAGRMSGLEDFDCDYGVLVSRREKRPIAHFWARRLRQKLPCIPIPLREQRGDALADLQAVLHEVYDEAGYDDFLYEREPEPSLRGDDAIWAKEIIAGRRAVS